MKPEYQPKMYLFVAIAAAAYILFTGPLFIQLLPILLPQIFGVLLIVWAILSIKLNKHHGEHKLHEGNFLVTYGPYEIIRHPIYAGVLLVFIGFVHGVPSIERYLAFTVLCIAIFLKMLNEEKLLENELKEYSLYKKKTHRIIPYLF